MSVSNWLLSLLSLEHYQVIVWQSVSDLFCWFRFNCQYFLLNQVKVIMSRKSSCTTLWCKICLRQRHVWDMYVTNWMKPEYQTLGPGWLKYIVKATEKYWFCKHMIASKILSVRRQYRQSQGDISPHSHTVTRRQPHWLQRDLWPHTSATLAAFLYFSTVCHISWKGIFGHTAT